MSTPKRFIWSTLVLILVSVIVAWDVGAREDVYRLDLPAVQTFTGELTPALPVLTKTLLIDAAEGAIIVSSTSVSLMLNLRDPSGNSYPFGGPLANGVESQAVPDLGEPGITGVNYMYSLNGVETGEWSIEVTQAGGVTEPVALFFTLLFVNSRAAILLGTNETYPMGVPVNLSFVVVDNGSIAHGLSPSGRMFKIGDPSFPDTEIQFLDGGGAGDFTAGDGIYTYQFSPNSPGQYQVNAKAESGSPSAHYLRTAAGRFFVVEPSGTFDGSFGDRGIDNDGDGFFDALGVSPGIDIVNGGTYVVSIILRASNGSSLQSSVVQSLLPSHSTPEVMFDTEDIRRALGVSGPYQVEFALLELQEAYGARTQDEEYDLGATSPYDLDDFAREALAVQGVRNAFGVDLNANGLFDRLDVLVGLDAQFGGSYSWSGRLVDRFGTELGFASGAGNVSLGETAVPLRFPGEPIGTNGVDGPYELRSFIMFGGGRSVIANDAGETGFLLASSFEGYVNPDVTPPVIKVNATPTTLWPPDHSMHEIGLEVLVVDDMDPDPEVVLASITSNQNEDQLGDGKTSDDIVIDENGAVSLRAERSGVIAGPRVYTLTYVATDDAGNSSTETVAISVPHDRRQPSVRGVGGASVGSPDQTGTQVIASSNAYGECSVGDLRTVRWTSAKTSSISSVDIKLRDISSREVSLVASGVPASGWHTWEINGIIGATYDVLLTALANGDRPIEYRASRYTVSDASEGVEDANQIRPLAVQAFPNPFNAATSIRYSLTEPCDVSLAIYNVLGQRVAMLTDEHHEAGAYSRTWDATGMASGTYFYYLTAGNHTSSQKLVLVK